MPRVNLYELRQPAIIVKEKTGIIYSNQTGGVGCFHPSVEGFVVLLPNPQKGVRVFDPEWWYKTVPAFTEELCAEIESALNQKHSFTWHIHNIRVDRNAKNHEAWVHVTFRGDFGPGMMSGGTFSHDVNSKADPEKYPLHEGILTWENCD